MSVRNQLRVAGAMLSDISGAFLAKEVRAIINTLDQPELQNQPCITEENGRWVTVAECREFFGPEFKTNHVFIKQCIAAYLGRSTKKAIEEVGLDVRACTPVQLATLLSLTNKAEQDAFVRMTAN
jgi:hypothetical protein